jgi:hypothetical protein
MGSTIRELNHHWGIHLTGSSKRRIYRTGTDAVDCGEGELARLGMIEEFLDLFTEEDACTKLFAHELIGVGYIVS